MVLKRLMKSTEKITLKGNNRNNNLFKKCLVNKSETKENRMISISINGKMH